MAAPIEAYRNKSLWMRAGSTTYEHKTAILQVDKATMLARFYLDDLVAANIDGTNDGVIGVVIIGGENEKMHNITTRGGVGRTRVNGQTARLLNDAGLNTLGIATGLKFNSVQVGNISFEAAFKSSYYAYTIDCGFVYRVNSQADVFYSKGGLSPNQSATLSQSTNPLSTIQAGDTVTIKAYVENEEGEFVSQEVVGTVTAKTISALFTTGWPSQASNPVTVYTKQSHTYTAIYSDAQTLNPAPDGYYVFDGYWYQQSGGVIVASGLAQSGSWPSGDPGNPSVQQEQWYGFSTISRQAALDNVQPTPLGTMYRNPANSLWYLNYNQTTNQFTNLVPTGFYAMGATGGLTYGIQNGQLMPPNWNG